MKFLKDIIHIHNKAIFDCLNENLDMERPFGMWGTPFPWKTAHKFYSNLTIAELEVMGSQFRISTPELSRK